MLANSAMGYLYGSTSRTHADSFHEAFGHAFPEVGGLPGQQPKMSVWPSRHVHGLRNHFLKTAPKYIQQQKALAPPVAGSLNVRRIPRSWSSRQSFACRDSTSCSSFGVPPPD